jgi:hypothetical protein
VGCFQGCRNRFRARRSPTKSFSRRVVPVGKPRKVETVSAVEARAGSKKGKKQANGPLISESVEVQRYAIDYAVTPAQLRFDTTPEGIHHGVLNFMVTAFDDDGTLRISSVNRATSNLKPESLQEVTEGGLRLHQEVDVPVKATSLRMGVQDALSGRMGTIEIALPVKALPGVEQSSRNSMPEIEPD